MSHSVYILCSPDRNTDKYNWGIFISPVEATKGTKYDVMRIASRWHRRYSQFDLLDAPKLDGAFLIGGIAGTKSFLHAMSETPLPGKDEQGKTWIRKVFERAITKGAILSSLLVRENLEAVPEEPS
jgi:hypothetical protein